MEFTDQSRERSSAEGVRDAPQLKMKMMTIKISRAMMMMRPRIIILKTMVMMTMTIMISKTMMMMTTKAAVSSIS